MQTTVRQLYASMSASTDNAANLQFVKRGHITGIHMALRVDGAADGDGGFVEVSFFPSHFDNTIIKSTNSN